MSGAPEVRVYDKLVNLGRPLAPLPRGTVPGGGVHGLVRPCQGEADDGVGVQRDEECTARGRGGGQGGLPAAGEQLLGDTLARQAPTCRRAIAPSSPRWAGLTERSGAAFTGP